MASPRPSHHDHAPFEAQDTLLVLACGTSPTPLGRSAVRGIRLRADS